MTKTMIAVAVLSLFANTAIASRDGPCTKDCGPDTPTPVVVVTSPPISVDSRNTNTNLNNNSNTNLNANLNLNNNSNTNTNRNNNEQAQSQFQGQNQVANGGQGGAGGQGGEGGNGYSAANASAQGGMGIGSASNSNTGNNTGTSTVVVEGDRAQDRNPVASAIAPTVVTGSDQCLVPVAVGGQGIGFGLSIGVAVRDENCEVLKLSREVGHLVSKEAAIMMLRMHDKRVDEALKAVGR